VGVTRTYQGDNRTLRGEDEYQMWAVLPRIENEREGGVITEGQYNIQ